MILFTQIQLIAFNSIYSSVCLDLLVACITIFLLYKGNVRVSFSYYNLLLFNIIVMILCIVLFRLEISVGTGIGLFAVLSMLRFRSEIIKIKDMFNLLLLIAIGIVHAAFPSVLTVIELVFVDLVILTISLLIYNSNRKLYTIKITLDDIKLIRPENRHKIQNVLEKRLGCRVKKYLILDVKFNRNKVEVLAVVDHNCIKNKNADVYGKTHVNIIENGQTSSNQEINLDDLVNI